MMKGYVDEHFILPESGVDQSRRFGISQIQRTISAKSMVS